MPWPAFGLWVWQASPAMNTRGRRVRDLLFRHVIELVAQPLADLVDRPPGDLLHVERIGIENPPRLRDQIVGRDVAVGDPLAGVELVELDIEAEQIAALARDDDDAAVVGGLDQRLEANVRESR